MKELRQRLYKRDPKTQILLMIEDFTLLQVIQPDLLEAMIEIPERGDESPLCPMRTVMAVTGGFFRRILTVHDTFRTRVQSIDQSYSLDVAQDGEYVNEVGI